MPRMNRNVIALTLLVLAGCSDKKLEKLGVTYSAPNGFDVIGEVGQPPTVIYSHQLLLTRIPEALPKGDAEHVATEPIRTAKLGRGWQARSTREGTLPAGSCYRFELASPQEQALVYAVPRANGFLMVMLRRPQGDAR